MKLVCVGGMDGIGKTTMLNHFARRHVSIIPEIDPNNTLISKTLEQFYKGQIDKLFYQMIFLYSNIDRYKKIDNYQSDELVLSDRSFIEDIIFAEVLLDGPDLENYRTVYHHLMEKTFKTHEKPAQYVILKGSFRKVQERLEMKAFEAANETLEGFIEGHIDFYKKLYHIYESKSSTFINILNKHNIPIVEFTIEEDSKKVNFINFVNLLNNKGFKIDLHS